MTDGVDAPMHRMQPPALEPMNDRALTNVLLYQLPPRGDTMLACRQGRDLFVDANRCRFDPYCGINRAHVKRVAEWV
jgi:hypothetical protein